MNRRVEIYIITITRAGSSDSTQATLNSLIVQSGSDAAVADAALALMPGFTCLMPILPAGGYVVYVADSVDMLTVRAGATHTLASVAITADTDADNDTDTASPAKYDFGHLVAMMTRRSMVKVTAEDGFTVRDLYD